MTAIRSWPENAVRPNVTDGTARFEVVGDDTDTVLIVMPSGKWTSSEPVQPTFWKSLINTVSRRFSGERLRMLSDSFSAGP